MRYYIFAFAFLLLVVLGVLVLMPKRSFEFVGKTKTYEILLSNEKVIEEYINKTGVLEGSIGVPGGGSLGRASSVRIALVDTIGSIDSTERLVFSSMGPDKNLIHETRIIYDSKNKKAILKIFFSPQYIGKMVRKSQLDFVGRTVLQSLFLIKNYNADANAVGQAVRDNFSTEKGNVWLK